MKRIIHSLAAILVTLATTTSAGAETTPVPQSTSPDGTFRLEVVAPTERYEASTLSLVDARTNKPLGATILGGYATYPLDSDPMNLGLLWSPDSKHFVLMVRDTKRSWTSRIYSVAERKMTCIELPSATTKALAEVKSSEGTFRACRETPLKWLDADHLIVRASGDTELKKHVIWYEVDITYSISEGKITESKLITTKPHEG